MHAEGMGRHLEGSDHEGPTDWYIVIGFAQLLHGVAYVTTGVRGHMLGRPGDQSVPRRENCKEHNN